MVGQILTRSQREGEPLMREQVEAMGKDLQQQQQMTQIQADTLAQIRQEQDELAEAQQRQYLEAIQDIERQRQEQPEEDPRLGAMGQTLGDLEGRLARSELEIGALEERFMTERTLPEFMRVREQLISQKGRDADPNLAQYENRLSRAVRLGDRREMDKIKQQIGLEYGSLGLAGVMRRLRIETGTSPSTTPVSSPVSSPYATPSREEQIREQERLVLINDIMELNPKEDRQKLGRMELDALHKVYERTVIDRGEQEEEEEMTGWDAPPAHSGIFEGGAEAGQAPAEGEEELSPPTLAGLITQPFRPEQVLEKNKVLGKDVPYLKLYGIDATIIQSTLGITWGKIQRRLQELSEQGQIPPDRIEQIFADIQTYRGTGQRGNADSRINKQWIDEMLSRYLPPPNEYYEKGRFEM